MLRQSSRISVTIKDSGGRLPKEPGLILPPSKYYKRGHIIEISVSILKNWNANFFHCVRIKNNSHIYGSIHLSLPGTIAILCQLSWNNYYSLSISHSKMSCFNWLTIEFLFLNCWSKYSEQLCQGLREMLPINVRSLYFL